MASGFDFEKLAAQCMADLDQTLPPFRAYYDRLNPEERAAFVAWVHRLSEPLGGTIEEYARMMNDLGCSNDGALDVEITLTPFPDGPTTRIYPPVLREAIATWERGEEFTPPPGIDMAT